jgi:hypothetical protein
MIEKLKDILKENRQVMLMLAALGIWILVFLVTFIASAQAGCTEDVGVILNEGGLCMARGLVGMSCLAGYFGLWTVLGGAVAKGKGRNPVIGWVLGLTLQFVGCIFMLMWKPRMDNAGRMIGWDEYKHYSKEEREAIKPKPVPVTPQMKKRRKIVIAIAVGAFLVMVLQILKNLGKIG